MDIAGSLLHQTRAASLRVAENVLQITSSGSVGDSELFWMLLCGPEGS